MISLGTSTAPESESVFTIEHLKEAIRKIEELGPIAAEIIHGDDWKSIFHRLPKQGTKLPTLAQFGGIKVRSSYLIPEHIALVKDTKGELMEVWAIVDGKAYKTTPSAVPELEGIYKRMLESI